MLLPLNESILSERVNGCKISAKWAIGQVCVFFMCMLDNMEHPSPM